MLAFGLLPWLTEALGDWIPVLRLGVGLTRDCCERVQPVFAALGQPSLPAVARFQGGERHEGFGVFKVPALSAAMDPLRGGLALGCRWAASDLPTLGA